MSGSGKALNLDELFGQARPVVVVWEGRKYALTRLEGLTPVEYARWTKLQRRMAPLFGGGDVDVNDMTEEQATELSEAVTTALSLFNADLAKAPLPFAAKVRVLQFYVEEVFESQEAGTPNPTGA